MQIFKKITLRHSPYKLCMLREIRSARQNARGLIRRWFTDTDMDLFIWLNNQAPVKFQLSYDKREAEHALDWHHAHGFTRHCIDDGEGRSARYKMSPILLNKADFIHARLLEYPVLRQVAPGQDVFSSDLKWG